MPRYKLTIEYDGTPFAGWQRQEIHLSVQQVLEDALFGVMGERLIVRGAGRTDSGVHATGQVAHIETSRAWRADTIRDAVNAHMRPHPVAVVRAEEAADDFDARHSAVKRHYLYRIINRRAPLTLEVQRAWLVKRRLDAQAMDVAAKRLIGKHDFSTFRDSECQAESPLRTLDQLDVTRVGDEIHIRCSARSFLHRQVRSMVGSLEYVGAGKWTADDLQAALEAKDRTRCGMVAPADGLYLVRVDY